MKKMYLWIVMFFLVFTSAFSPLPQGPDGGEKTPEPPAILISPEMLQQTPLPPLVVGTMDELMQSPKLIDGIEVIDPGNILSPGMGGVNPMTIDVAVTSAIEQAPKVAYCGLNQYLAVYTASGDIFGQRIDTSGNLIGAAFRVNENESLQNHDANPDIACEWSHNRYIVTWTHDFNASGDYDIHAQGVLGVHQSAGSQLVGNLLVVADSASVENSSSIACNRTSDYTCLVAYEYAGSGSGDILGKLVLVGTTNLTFADPAAISIGGFGAAEADPNVAWGVADENFIVGWQYVEGSGRNSVIYAVLEDKDVAGDQVLKGGTYLIGATPAADQYDPAIAYNPEDNTFLLTMTLSVSASSTILGKFISGDGMTVVSTNFGLGMGYYPSIAWFGGGEAFSGAMGGKKFGVTYVNYSSSEGFSIMGVTVGPTEATILDIYTTPVKLDQVKTSGWMLDGASICGNSDTGRALTAWTRILGSTLTSNRDVLAMLVAPYTSYVPLTIK